MKKNKDDEYPYEVSLEASMQDIKDIEKGGYLFWAIHKKGYKYFEIKLNVNGDSGG